LELLTPLDVSSREGLAKLKTIAVRRGLWFKVLSALERAVVDLTLKVVERVEGRVEVGRGAKIVNSVVRGPSIIGEDCVIENSYVGPYTSVGRGSKIVNSSVEYCVILENASIIGVERLEESLIGRNAKVVKGEGNRRFVKLNVGDYSEVVL
jgi:glucose-1-phosphate thymidylyltransferase